MGALKIVLCLVVLVIAIGVGAAFAVRISAQNRSIGFDAAADLALADAGVARVDATEVRTVFERDDGVYVFDVAFWAHGCQYAYTIRAADGTILERDIEGKRMGKVADTRFQGCGGEAAGLDRDASGESGTFSAAELGRLTAAQAKAVALADVGLASSQVTFTEAHMAYDDGKYVYDVAFYTDDTDYEYEIHATTGTIIEMSAELQEGLLGDVAAAGDDRCIGVDRAKAIALEHAGIAERDAAFYGVSRERDGGEPVYELAFIYNHLEYKYKIHGTAGAILAFSSGRPN